jgi:multidrug resistance efflux pump
MVAEPKKAPSIEAELIKTLTADVSASAGPAADTVVEQRLAALDVRAQSALLQHAFKTREPLLPDEPASNPSPERSDVVRRVAWRALKSVLGLGVVIVAGRLDDLQRQIDQAESDRPAAAVRLTRLKEIYEQISHQARAFQTGRIRELEERVMDLKAQAAATEASESEATSTLARTRALAVSGYQTPVAVERAERDARVAEQTKHSLDHRLFAGVVELEAARRGEYVGDSYNDRPSSLQHADELSIRIAETEADLQSREQHIASLRAALDAEASRYVELSNAELSSPANARVWEVLVSPGEEVRKGQDLVRLLDCSGAIVTATVRESIFNRLRPGDKAQFRFSEQSGRYDGTVVRMSGVAAPSDNLAIQQTGLSPGGYRVAVSVPDFASTQCGVGRTGTVVFNPSSGGGGPLQSLRHALSFFLLGS